MTGRGKKGGMAMGETSRGSDGEDKRGGVIKGGLSKKGMLGRGTPMRKRGRQMLIGRKSQKGQKEGLEPGEGSVRIRHFRA